MDQLIKVFNKYLDLNSDELGFIKDNTEVVVYPKNHLILKEGEVSSAFYFVLDGCLRLFYETDAVEKCAFFYTENMFVSSYLSFIKQLPSTHNIATMEQSVLVRFDITSVGKYIQFSPKFGTLAKIMMEEELATYQKIVSSFVTKSAEERYLEFIDEHADLQQRIPQHYIATYLGVSPETLSRIRKRLIKK